MKRQSDYWAKNVLSWEKSAYYKDEDSSPAGMRFWDRVSSFIRGDSIYRRSNYAFELIKNHIDGKTIVDVGCASGKFARRLLKHGARHVTGIDVSADALELAKKLCLEQNFGSEQAEFILQDVTGKDEALPNADLTVSLGVIEYFDEPSLTNFMANLNSQYYFLSFPQRQQNAGLRSLLRSIYLRLQACPGIYFYTLEEFQDICTRAGLKSQARIIRSGGSPFITNLPED